MEKNSIIFDDLKKESKTTFKWMLFLLSIAVVVPLFKFIKNGEMDYWYEIPLYVSCFVIAFSYYIYRKCYSINVFEDQIEIKTLFGKKKFTFSEVKRYKFRITKNHVYGIYTFYADKRKYKLITRYYEKLNRILENYNMKFDI